MDVSGDRVVVIYYDDDSDDDDDDSSAGLCPASVVTVRFQFTRTRGSDVFMSTDLELFVRQIASDPTSIGLGWYRSS